MSLKGHVTYHSLHASAATRLNEIGVIRKTHFRKISDIGYELSVPTKELWRVNNIFHGKNKIRNQEMAIKKTIRTFC